MSDAVLLDNDIILKVCCFDVAVEVTTLLSEQEQVPWGLGLAKFVLRRRVSRVPNLENRERIATAIEQLLAVIGKLEPDDGEVELAADLEATAQASGLALDSGESLLVAILVHRSAALLLTGDKRAIEAIAHVSVALRHADSIEGKVACLEQLIMTIGERLGLAELRSRICAERHADRSLSICFGCSSQQADDQSTLAGLQSYVEDLRQRSGSVLVLGTTISRTVS